MLKMTQIGQRLTAEDSQEPNGGGESKYLKIDRQEELKFLFVPKLRLDETPNSESH
jgi:hypothetical protein